MNFFLLRCTDMTRAITQAIENNDIFRKDFDAQLSINQEKINVKINVDIRKMRSTTIYQENFVSFDYSFY